MTLIQALCRLQEAGRIASSWLPGMVLADHDQRCARLAWSDETHWHASYDGPTTRGGWMRFLAGDFLRKRNGWSIVLTDPATVGCLLALLREAARPWTPPDAIGAESGRDAKGWHVWLQTGPYARDRYDAPTEGAAIAAALIALAERRSRRVAS